MSFVAWGLAALGLTAALAAPLALNANRVSAEQLRTTGDVNTARMPGAAKAAYSIKLIKQSASSFKLKGIVATEDDRKALLGLVKASFPSADVTDRMKVSDGPRTGIKLGGISFALKALSFLQSGAAGIDEQGVALSGDAESGAVYDEFKSFVNSPPIGVVVKEAKVAQPAATFAWRAEVGNGQVKLSGAVPASTDKKELEAAVQKLFSGLEFVDDTSVAKGAPESWLDAAMNSLQVLRLFDFGFVQLADHKIQLDGHASDEGKLRKIDTLADDYPTGFALESKVSAPTQASVIMGFPQAATTGRVRGTAGTK